MFTFSCLENPPFSQHCPSHCMTRQSLDLAALLQGANQRLFRASESLQAQHGSFAKPNFLPMMSIRDGWRFLRRRPGGGSLDALHPPMPNPGQASG